jgi:hypothetical protein
MRDSGTRHAQRAAQERLPEPAMTLVWLAAAGLCLMFWLGAAKLLF